MRASIWAKIPFSAQYRVLSRSKIQFFTWRKSGRKPCPDSAPAPVLDWEFSAMPVLSMGAEHGLGGTRAQAPLTNVHHAYLRAVKAPWPTIGARRGLKAGTAWTRDHTRTGIPPRPA